MKTLTAMILAAGLFAAPAYAATVVVPGGGAPGDAMSPTPLNYHGASGSENQQIYSSSFFSGPTTISGVSFRAYPGASPGPFSGNSVSVSDLVVKLATTSASPNENAGAAPSITFADNLGADVSTVFSGAITLTTAATGAGPQPFDYTVNFSTPFVYNPANGNLVLDFQIPTGATVSGPGFGFLGFDTANDLNDGVFSVVNINSGSSATGVLSTAATITAFQTSAAVPEPAAWAFMICGLLMTGSALRLRRTAVTA
jgi:hypothetical protein